MKRSFFIDSFYKDGKPKRSNAFIKTYKPIPDWVRHWEEFNNTNWVEYMNKGEVGG